MGWINGVNIPQGDFHLGMCLPEPAQCFGFYVLCMTEQQQIGLDISATFKQALVGKTLPEVF
jgi:hypothetical protein